MVPWQQSAAKNTCYHDNNLLDWKHGAMTTTCSNEDVVTWQQPAALKTWYHDNNLQEWRHGAMTTTCSNEDMVPWQQPARMKTWCHDNNLKQWRHVTMTTCKIENMVPWQQPAAMKTWYHDNNLQQWRCGTMTTTCSNEDMLPWQQLTAMKTWTFVWDILALQNFQIGTCQHQNFWEKFWWNHINLHCSPSTLHSSFCTISFRWCMLNISRENFWHTVSSELTLGAAAWNRISWTAVVLVLIMEITATRVSGRLGLAWSLAKCIMTLMQLLSYTDTGVNVPVMNRNGSEGTCIEQKREWRYLYWSDTGLNVLE